MHLNTRIRVQLVVFTVVSLVALIVMAFGYIRLPNLLFGAGHYTVTVQLPVSGGLEKNAIVTYRGTEVGRVEDVQLTDSGTEALMSLKSNIEIPSDLRAEVHSRSAIGEQYVALNPRSGDARPLRQGDVIAQKDTSVPPDINSLLDATNTALAAIPQDNLKTFVDESYTAVGGLGPEISRIVKGSTSLAIDGRQNLDSLTGLIDNAWPVLDSQTATADAVSAWSSHLATITSQLEQNDASVSGLLKNGGPAAGEARALVDRLQPTVPILLANLVSLGEVALTYQPGIEQLLVLLPEVTATAQGFVLPNLGIKSPYNGVHINFDLNVNLPPPCTTGYLPVQQQRPPSFEDYPDRPPGDLYCRIPQDSPFGVRGARNIPCETVPGKRAPSAKMCESDEQYVPLNDGYNWKGDPNATISGQDIPQPPPGTPGSAAPSEPDAPVSPPPPVAPPPIAAAAYDPTTGTYTGPDGKMYTQTDLVTPTRERTWQSMLMPATGN
jgi:phospholipid/cholesterol/gamma-HCH transport system substrate-binding protein